MEACIREVKIWLCDNGLILNENKSEAFVIRSPKLRTPITISGINIYVANWWTHPRLSEISDSLLTLIYRCHLKSRTYVAALVITCPILLRYEILLPPMYAKL